MHSTTLQARLLNRVGIWWGWRDWRGGGELGDCSYEHVRILPGDCHWRAMEIEMVDAVTRRGSQVDAGDFWQVGQSNMHCIQ